MAATEYAFHVHHEKLYEPLTEPIENRIKFIESAKPATERTLRLKLIRVVRDQKTMAKAVADLDAGWKAYDKALSDTKTAKPGKDYEQASDRGGVAFADLAKATAVISNLHKKECEPDCPWNGSTIFGARV